MDDMRMVKFESLIEDISRGLYYGKYISTGNDNKLLSLVFDYEKCNDYAKIIMDHSRFYVCPYLWWHYSFGECKDYLNNPKDKIATAKKLLTDLNENSSSREDAKLYFIFWNLMILTVDKSDAEEHLTLICDFAQSLHISDEEFGDIIQVIKMVYNRSGDRSILKSENVEKEFSSLLDYLGIT